MGKRFSPDAPTEHGEGPVDDENEDGLKDHPTGPTTGDEARRQTDGVSVQEAASAPTGLKAGEYRLVKGKHTVIDRVDGGQRTPNGDILYVNENRSLKVGDVVTLTERQAIAFRDKFERV